MKKKCPLLVTQFSPSQDNFYQEFSECIEDKCMAWKNKEVHRTMVRPAHCSHFQSVDWEVGRTS